MSSSSMSSRLAVLPLLAWAGAAAVSPDSMDIRTCAPRIPAPLQRHGRFLCPSALDEATARASGPSSWSPWTHLPVCARASQEGDEEEEEDDDDDEMEDDDGDDEDGNGDDAPTQFCVYTNHRHGIGGLSIVTTPETAAASMAVWDEALPAPPELARNASLAYTVVDVPGRGKGVVATRRIRQYEAFMVDYAALAVDLRVAGGAVPRDEGYRLLGTAAGQVSDPARVLGLAQTNTVARHPVENVLRSNAFHTALGANADDHMALYPDLARINHACMPNAFARFLPHSLAVTVAAARDIAPGEEITVSCRSAHPVSQRIEEDNKSTTKGRQLTPADIPLGQTRAARQQALLRWNFVCQCPLCAAAPADVDASDARRIRIDEQRASVEQAVARRHSSSRAAKLAALETIRDLFPRLQEEEVFTAYGEQYANIGRLYWALGDRSQAQFYAQRSLDTLADQGFLGAADRDKVHLLMRTF
ncbi:uncharacterized protein SPSK_01700 [Sporothrix schenckii 1099-18]|uniref:SET domain-containing protein n=1 Tax=Sporothrix schenckii 1099-18 TaxID=1397361 RepID=A0A0F2MF92_SPOSC|nr:uncharacterized protein SPSK_01700 [Sporothrix schenckii 1099-18]KJR87495.1 hypothetical protein SPSK_01700 [Sporothrix schenckii 1099-18]